MILEYVWIDGQNNIRSKTRLVTLFIRDKLKDISKVPMWNFDGSSTHQATTTDSEILLKPVKLYNDPFRRNEFGSQLSTNYIVLCETYNIDNTPHQSNTRSKANTIFESVLDEKPLFGLEQEFFISELSFGNLFPVDYKFNETQGTYHYCGSGGNNINHRHILEEVLDNLLYSNIEITGMNAEVAPSQWEYQVCNEGINAADDLIILRYICNRTLEHYNFTMDIRAKPVEGDWNGSGCHINFSTEKMRTQSDTSYQLIENAINNLKLNHNLHIKYYGNDNKNRLTGKHETSNLNTFSFGVGSRNTSIRIPNDTFKKKYGYLEDRRPSSSIDPYIATSLLFASALGLNQTEWI